MNSQTTLSPPAPDTLTITLLPQTALLPRSVNRTDLQLDDAFKADIAEHGVRVPIIVRPLKTAGKNGVTHEIVCGERRWTANGLTPRTTIPCLIRDLDDQAAGEEQLRENLQRAGLTALDEAQLYDERLKTGNYGTGAKAIETLSQRIQVSRSTIYSRLKLLKMHPEIRRALASGQIEQSVADLLATIPDPAGQEQALKRVAKGDSEWNPETGKHERQPMSFRQVKEFVTDDFRRSLRKACFDLKKEYICNADPTGKKPGSKTVCSCEACPKRTGNFPDLPAATNPDICTDTACFDEKINAEWRARCAKAYTENQRTIQPSEWLKLQFSGNYKKLDDDYWTGHNDAKVKTLVAKALAAGQCKTILVRNPDGEIFEVVETADIKKFGNIKETHSASSSGSGGASKEEKAREAKKNLRRAVAVAAAPLLIAAFRKVKEADLWYCLADSAFEHTGIEDHTFVAKRRGLCKTQGDAREALQDWIGAKERTAEEHRDVALELLLFCRHGIGTWNQSWSGEFEDVCALAKIDLAKLEKEIAAEQQKPKAKPAVTKPAKAAAKVKTKAKK